MPGSFDHLEPYVCDPPEQLVLHRPPSLELAVDDHGRGHVQLVGLIAADIVARTPTHSRIDGVLEPRLVGVQRALLQERRAETSVNRGNVPTGQGSEPVPAGSLSTGVRSWSTPARSSK
jgi:hypothetical protein